MKQHLLRRVERFVNKHSSHRINNRILHVMFGDRHVWCCSCVSTNIQFIEWLYDKLLCE